jgi:hypothetical protein
MTGLQKAIAIKERSQRDHGHDLERVSTETD